MRIIAAMVVFGATSLAAQTTPYQQYAPIDLTGQWVSLVTEDWEFRMLTPPKGDFVNLPLNAEAVKIANAWDPAREDPANACQAYAAPTNTGSVSSDCCSA